MNSYDLFNYAKTGAEFLAGGTAVYALAITGLQIPSLFGKRIKSEEELRRIVNEESRKLHIDPKKIKSIYGKLEEDGENFEVSSSRLGKKRFQLNIGGYLHSTRGVVKHELYHIKKDVPKPFKRNNPLHWMRYLFVEEPRATIYGSFGIKL